MQLHPLVSRVATSCGSLVGGFLAPFLVLLVWPGGSTTAQAAPLVGNCQNSITNTVQHSCPDCTVTDYDVDSEPGVNCEPCTYSWRVGLDCGGVDKSISSSGSLSCGAQSAIKPRCPAPNQTTVVLEFTMNCGACPP
jgi:hypothetical protein